jgi:hypothetical protein
MSSTLLLFTYIQYSHNKKSHKMLQLAPVSPTDPQSMIRHRTIKCRWSTDYEMDYTIIIDLG